ncbi:hypothetical protein EAX61_07460 [Dokdonia sinensis]|uniref:CARDB domain-containing protein n=1 Tax=Dokdonia sinensis TaxID=2479847 RepID=A0A3M0GQ73_9FLAO|nr:gliding motility-associated C-terminal domain-containing protein [Dokdonia sinensis]RMB59416.1 hypothetical protein EAX61_07460 [Dokdonia sinensis]
MNKNYFLLLVIATLSLYVNAQEISPLVTFNGNFDYKAFGNTMNLQENGGGGACDILAESAATFELEDDQFVQAAYLYWAGTGTGDFDVALNGIPITASRTFEDSIDENRVFFAAFYDVTEILQNQGPGDYTLSELDVSDQIPAYCPSGTNFAGWAITVIFRDFDLPLNQVNVFDGLQSVSSTVNTLEIELENLNVIDNEDAKIGFIAWEGDAGLAVNETLSINGNLLSNAPLNPENNQFNGTNSFTGANDLYNMDIDFYDIEDNINIGDMSATIQLTSGQDFVMINNIITVLNSTLPDALIALDNATVECQARDVFVTYTVSNEGTEALPANTPIAFYANEILVGNATTTAVIGIGENLTGTATIVIPTSIPDEFDLIAVVDDTGNGTGIVNETNEDNNESEPLEVNFNSVFIAAPPQDFIVCDDASNDGVEIFDFTSNATLAIGDQTNVTLTYHFTQEDADNGVNPINNPEAFENSENPQDIFIRLELYADTSCFASVPFMLEVIPLPIIEALDNTEVCDDESNDGVAIFDLTFQNETILNGQSEVIITFHLSEEDALSGENPIADPETYENIASPQIIYVRLTSRRLEGCIAVSSFTIEVDDIAVVQNSLEDLIRCDGLENDGVDTFDLSINEALATGNQTDVVVTFHISQEDANAGIDAVLNPSDFTNTSNPQTIFLRIVQDEDNVCFSTDSFLLKIFEQPIIPVLNNQRVCDDISNDGVSQFDLTLQESEVLNNQEEFVISYHLLTNEALTGDNPINTDEIYTNITNPQEIFVRLENPLDRDCFDVKSFMLFVDATAPTITLPDIVQCNEGFERSIFDLSENIDDLNLDAQEFVEGYYFNALDALNQENPIENPFNYTNTTSPETVFIRIDDDNPDTCYRLAKFDISIENCPPFVPDGFSPNNDGVNDTFEITGIQNVFDYRLFIYSRLGNLIFEGSMDDGFWDGTPNKGFGGSELPTGTYFYVLKLYTDDYDDITGWVYLNR